MAEVVDGLFSLYLSFEVVDSVDKSVIFRERQAVHICIKWLHLKLTVHDFLYFMCAVSLTEHWVCAEKARIEAELKAAEVASRRKAEADLKMQRERQREAARIALQKVDSYF